MKNIVLIGMPGSGKSTLGVILAKTLGVDFIDTDIVIQSRTGELLYKTLERVGVSGLLDEEEKAICSLRLSDKAHVISTGGSAVLRESSMAKLRENGIVVYLSLPYEIIQKRVGEYSTRGIAAEHGESLRDIYDYRLPFYQKYADYTVDGRNKSIENMIAEILRMLIE